MHSRLLTSSRAARRASLPAIMVTTAVVFASACALHPTAQNDSPSITVDEAAGDLAPPPAPEGPPATSAPAPTATPTSLATSTPAAPPTEDAATYESVSDTTSGWLEPATDSPLPEPPPPAPAPETGPLVAFQRGAQIVVMRPDGSGERTLVAGSDPAWSPDGTRLAFTAPDGGIAIVDAAGSNIRRLTTYGRNPDWSPDGARLVFDTDRDPATGTTFPPPPGGTYYIGGSRLYVVGADGSALHRITEIDSNEPAWSPDGSRIAFACMDHALFLCVSAADGSQVTAVYKGSGHNPAWNPTGTMVAFEENDYATPAGGVRISLIDPVTHALTPLTDPAQMRATQPAWSSDGATILFTRSPAPGGTPTSIAMMNVDGSGLRDLTAGPADARPDARAAIG